MVKVYYKSFKHGIKLTDLYKTLEYDKSKKLGDALEKNWDKQVLSGKEKNQEPSLLKAILNTFLWRYMCIGILLFVQYVVFRCSLPVVLSYLIKCFTNTRIDVHNEMYISATALGGILIMSIFINHHAHAEELMIGMRIRVAISSLIYRKVSKSRLKISCG